MSSERFSSTLSSDTVIACLAILSLSETMNHRFCLTFTVHIGAKLISITWILNKVMSQILLGLYRLQHLTHSPHKQNSTYLPCVLHHAEIEKNHNNLPWWSWLRDASWPIGERDSTWWCTCLHSFVLYLLFSAPLLDIYFKYIQLEAEILKACKFPSVVMCHSWLVHVCWVEKHGGEGWLLGEVQRGRTVGLCVLNASFTHLWVES